MNRLELEFDKIAKQFLEVKSLTPEIEKAIEVCIRAIKNDRKILFCGNGGSASQSQHLAAELVGRYKLDRLAMNSLALTVDTSVLTAVGNDYGYDEVFARQIEGIGREGDVLFGLSTSGNSRNVLLAFEKAKNRNIFTIALTGRKESKMKESADLALAVPADESNHIQELHLAIGHLICGEIEDYFYGKKD